MNQPRQIPRSEIKANESLCDYCTAKCCRYFSLPLEEPDTAAEFDYIRWYLLHEHATVFTEENSWFLLVHTTCKHLQPDNRCGIYETRPKICRDYTTEQCEYDDDYTFDRYFELPEQIEEYSQAKFQSISNFRSPKPGLPVIQ